MNKNKEKQSENDGPASEPATLDLRGRQSVRATFRLSEACIEAISILSAQLGIKQKSVFDHLMEDDRVLNNMARDLENTKFDRHERIQKTFVVSRLLSAFALLNSFGTGEGAFALGSDMNLRSNLQFPDAGVCVEILS